MCDMDEHLEEVRQEKPLAPTGSTPTDPNQTHPGEEPVEQSIGPA